MSKFLWWSAGIIFVTVLIAGVGTAYAITHTITSTTGKTSGLIVGGIPDLVNGFRQGFSAGGGHKGTPGTSWTGPNPTWGSFQGQPHRKAPAHHHHVKPNA